METIKNNGQSINQYHLQGQNVLVEFFKILVEWDENEKKAKSEDSKNEITV